MQQPVRAQTLLGGGRAQLPLGRGQLERGAVGGIGHPAVGRGHARMREREAAVDHIGRGAVGQERHRERDAEHRCPREPVSPSGSEQQHVTQCGQQQDLADLPDRHRRPEQQARRQGDPPGHGRLPQQDDQPGHDQCLEEDIRHDHLLELQLVSVKQDRRDGERSQPAGHPPADQQAVQGHRHPDAQHVLEQRDHVEVADEQDRPQRDPVADRVVAIGVIQVPGRVLVEKCRPVGQLHEHSQHHAGRDEHGCEPVPPQRRQPAGQPGLLARGAGRAAEPAPASGAHCVDHRRGSPSTTGAAWQRSLRAQDQPRLGTGPPQPQADGPRLVPGYPL